MACRVISLDLSWNFAGESQAFDRVHRLGQSKTVIMERLTCDDTIGESFSLLVFEAVTNHPQTFRATYSEVTREENLVVGHVSLYRKDKAGRIIMGRSPSRKFWDFSSLIRR